MIYVYIHINIYSSAKLYLKMWMVLQIVLNFNCLKLLILLKF